MPLCNIDSPDGLETCLNDPGYKDEQGDCCSRPDYSDADSVPLPVRIIVLEY
jgi:hypothetical protein